MARLRSTIHISRGMLSHSFMRSFVSILSMPNLPRQLLQCQITQMPITIHEAFSQSQAGTLVYMHTS
jgi:hypothetical protein